jgi:electron transfer flavoprotein beta subunit
MIADMLDLPFANACNGLEIDGNEVTLNREIDGGIEKIKSSLPIIIGGQKGLVEESELRIPNMRGIMTARSKPLNIIEVNNPTIMSESIQFEKPAEKGECKMVSSDNIDQLVNMLQNEAKVI